MTSMNSFCKRFFPLSLPILKSSGPIDDIPVYLAVDSAADMVLSLQCFAPMDGLQIDLQIDAQNMITGWEVVLSD